MTNPSKWRDTVGISITHHIHNEMDEPIPNRIKKYSLCKSERHNYSNYPYKQVDDYNIFTF